ncbi:hypothetical protein NEMBOFW57_007057 [Staphylotrichum longicolle]|uniref:Uncharacterized protein n=1 Tax=Staphylotrichum longicolle TaxID=669026 RepID=A0AAD4EUF5_9PEZI|nr:hypothetical protein NEMBOFW57_007057 [Staphylotrichum longicolle]
MEEKGLPRYRILGFTTSKPEDEQLWFSLDIPLHTSRSKVYCDLTATDDVLALGDIERVDSYEDRWPSPSSEDAWTTSFPSFSLTEIAVICDDPEDPFDASPTRVRIGQQQLYFKKSFDPDDEVTRREIETYERIAAVVANAQAHQLPLEDPPHLIIPEDDPAHDEFDYSKMTIPTIIKLKGKDNFAAWKEAVRSCFVLYRITRFINNTATIPGAETTTAVRLKFLRDRTMAHQILRQSVEPVIDILESYGWEDGKDNPQGLYDIVIKAVSRVTDESWCNTTWELMSLNATKFDSLRAFLIHYNKCVKKLRDVDIEFPDKAKQAIILRALKDYDESWTSVMKYHLQTGDLTYDKLMQLVTAKANEQSFNNMAATVHQ